MSYFAFVELGGTIMRLLMNRIVLCAAVTVVATPALAGDPPVAAKKTDPTKIICHTEQVTGSLAQTIKRCQTKAQWDEHAVAGQAIARRLVNDSMGRPTTN